MRQLSKLRAAAFAVAATLSYATALGQSWPQWWHTSVNYADEGQCVAVDHWGNVFVAGKSKEPRTTSGYYDMLVIKYDAAGNRLWTNAYHSSNGGSAYSGDTVATGIAVDWRGAVYVSGVAYSGSTRKNDLFVIKYDSGGTPVWPTSGTHSTPDYDFDHGALRLSDSNDDGYDKNGYGNDGTAVCAISMENVDSDQPTFAITGPSRNNSYSGIWRTVVFTYDGTDGIKIKSGWPVNDFGNSSEDSPYAVAIDPSDDTVAVTGGAHDGGAQLYFTTVRYLANGSAQIWKDEWAPDSTKNDGGRAIALDKSGDVYVTGILGEGESDSEYGTRKILKADNDGASQPQWSQKYDNGSGGRNEATSLSLSYEVESGVLKTYVYVTGLSAHSSGDATLEMATLRYRGTDGVKQWSGDGAKREAVSSHDVLGNMVVAAGRGNCYVVGKSNDDYILAVYDKTGTHRFSPVTYDGTGSSTDEAKAIIMGGAGAEFFTGVSTSSSSGLDVLTLNNAETVTSHTPVKLDDGNSGTRIIGDASDVDTSDDSYLVYEPFESYYTSSLSVEFGAEVLTSNPSEISLTIEGHVDGTNVWQKVEVYDVIANTYVVVSDQPASIDTDENTVIVLKDDPARFISSSHAVDCRITYYGDYSTTGWLYGVDGAWYAYVDLIRWDVLGP
jgi:hypothetical protein